VKAIRIFIYLAIGDIQRLDVSMELVVLSKLPIQRFRKEEVISVCGVTFPPFKRRR
jgi:hypothetical protein